MLNLDSILKNGITLLSSGTTGTPKQLFQTPEKLRAANRAAIESQKLSKNSKVYTVCKTQHAGGLLAQTLPAHSIGAKVTIEDFNAYRFMRVIHNYTHTHLTPDHAKAIMGTKGFREATFNGITVTCGSDRVEWNIIREFVKRGATFIANWGMTEVGPIAINKTYIDIDQIDENTSPAGTTILGNNYFCIWRVVDGRLFVRGDISIYDDWYDTGDKVIFQNSNLYYNGRA